MPPHHILMLDLLEAIELNDIEKVKTILSKNPELSKGERSPKSPLWTAAVLGHHEIVNLIVKFGKLDVNEKKYRDEYTLLHWMGTKVTSCTEEHFEVFRVLVRHGVEVNAKDREGKTPFDYAVQEGNTEWSEFLLKNGAEKNNVPDSSEFEMFVESDVSCVEKLKKLFQRGLDPKYLNKNGNNLVNMLLGNYNKKNADNVVELVKVLKDAGVSINEENKRGKTPLHYAVDMNNPPLISYLITEGADVNHNGKFGYTPLQWAVKQKFKDSVETFLYHGAGEENKTAALHIACTYNCVDIIRLLLQNGVDVTNRDENGKTPFYNLLENFPNGTADEAIQIMIREFAKLTFKNILIDGSDMFAIQNHCNAKDYFFQCLIELQTASDFKFYCFYSYLTVLEMSNDLRNLSKMTRNLEFNTLFYTHINRFIFYREDLIKIFEEAVKFRNNMKINW